ncbi:hypothetical protein ACQ4M3_39300 [Leptolyngbya sp. AN03gr2]|uniref:hypothetical protein n=1 Tax=unclassified Leptolyngbya TaxID=2650499 RepID=UPI003D31E592
MDQPVFVDAKDNLLLLPQKSRSIYPDFIGYNGDTHLLWKGNPWDDAKLLQTFTTLSPGTIRYPDGSPANYWDWKVGHLDTTLDTRKFMVPWWMGNLFELKDKAYTVENLHKAAIAAKASVVFNLNVVTDNEGVGAGRPEYQIKMLKYWQNLGMPLKYVELGNELSAKWQESLIAEPDDYKNQAGYTAKYNTSKAYISDMKWWISELRKNLQGNYKVALVGAASPPYQQYRREKEWNLDLDASLDQLFGSDKANALTLHHYYDTSANSPGAVSTDDFITKGLDGWYYTLNDTFLKHFKNPNFRKNVELWITEYNIDGSGEGKWYDTWNQALYIAAFLNEQLRNEQVTLTNFHGLYKGQFGALKEDLSLSQPGRVLQLFGQAMKGMTAAVYYGPKSSKETMLNQKYQGVFAWLFSNATERSMLLFNLTQNEQTISISQPPFRRNVTVNTITEKGKVSSKIPRRLHQVKLPARSIGLLVA